VVRQEVVEAEASGQSKKLSSGYAYGLGEWLWQQQQVWVRVAASVARLALVLWSTKLPPVGYYGLAPVFR